MLQGEFQVALTKLQVLDNCPVDGNQFTDEFRVWITQQVDILNYDIQLVDSLLASIDARLTAGGL